MKRIGLGWALLALLGVASTAVWADYGQHRGHHRGHWRGGVGVYVGAPWPGYYYGYPPFYYPPYYYPQVVVAPAAPTIYIEKSDAAVAVPQAPAYWYYCSDPQGYYPYVKECPVGWQKVAPQPPSEPQ